MFWIQSQKIICDTIQTVEDLKQNSRDQQLYQYPIIFLSNLKCNQISDSVAWRHLHMFICFIMYIFVCLMVYHICACAGPRALRSFWQYLYASRVWSQYTHRHRHRHTTQQPHTKRPTYLIRVYVRSLSACTLRRFHHHRRGVLRACLSLRRSSFMAHMRVL